MFYDLSKFHYAVDEYLPINCMSKCIYPSQEPPTSRRPCSILELPVWNMYSEHNMGKKYHIMIIHIIYYQSFHIVSHVWFATLLSSGSSRLCSTSDTDMSVFLSNLGFLFLSACIAVLQLKYCQHLCCWIKSMFMCKVTVEFRVTWSKIVNSEVLEGHTIKKKRKEIVVWISFSTS